MLDQRVLAGRRVVAAPAGSVCAFGWLIGQWAILIFCGFGLSPAAAEDQGGGHVLGTGANLRVAVFGRDDLSGDVEFDASGQAALPLVGDMPVHDPSRDFVAQLFVAALGPVYLRNPSVNVEIVNYRPPCLDGEFASSGSHSYDVGGTRTMDGAVSTGDTYRADERVQLTSRSTDDRGQGKAGRDRPVFPVKVVGAQSGSIDFF